MGQCGDREHASLLLLMVTQWVAENATFVRSEGELKPNGYGIPSVEKCWVLASAAELFFLFFKLMGNEKLSLHHQF